MNLEDFYNLFFSWNQQYIGEYIAYCTTPIIFLLSVSISLAILLTPIMIIQIFIRNLLNSFK